MKSSHAALMVVAAGLIAITGFALAGPLNPPLGPVTSTYKTLTEVEPRTAITLANTPGDANSLFKITQPGSYYLTGSVTGVPGKHGIEIANDGVRLDLNGFELVGTLSSLDGVSLSFSGLRDICVMNGSVRTWGGDGVDLFTHLPISVIVRDIQAYANGGHGISTATMSVVSGCVAGSNGQSGILVSTGSAVRGCTARENRESGVTTFNGCLITQCAVTANGLSGINAGSSCTITDCTADGNGNLATTGHAGILAGGGSVITNCSAQNTTSTFFGGVGTYAMGFSLATRSTISHCTAAGNRGHGIGVAGDCHVISCTSGGNGGGTVVSAAIFIAGAGNAVEGNVANGCDVGIQAVAAGNFIIRNMARGNSTNFSLAADNIYGPIIDRRVPTTLASTPAVTGSAAASTLGSTDTNANFAY